MCDKTEQATANCCGNSATYVCVKLNGSCDKVSSGIWMNGWLDGWMDGWMDGLMDDWMHGWMDRQTDEYKDGGKEGRMVGRKNGFIKGWIAKGWRERATDRSVMFGNN